MNRRHELTAELLMRPGVSAVRVYPNEFGAWEVEFRTPYADMGRNGWSVGEDAEEALDGALAAEEFLRGVRQAYTKARGTP